jgi:hypothetical protein
MASIDTFRFLMGHWSLERTIDDHLAKMEISVNGVAAITDTTHSASGAKGRWGTYVENGELCIDGHHGPTNRLLNITSEPDSPIILRFADARIFADLDLRTGIWHATHRCGQDRYEITTRIVSDQEIEELWQVIGPYKNYSAMTKLQRA